MNLKNLATILALIHCKILDEPGENSIRIKAEEYLFNTGILTKESFMQVEFPFEKDLSTSLRTGKRKNKALIYFRR